MVVRWAAMVPVVRTPRGWTGVSAAALWPASAGEFPVALLDLHPMPAKLTASSAATTLADDFVADILTTCLS